MSTTKLQIAVPSELFNRLIYELQYSLEVLDNYVDVVDGEDGTFKPNRAMSAHTGLKEIHDQLYNLLYA